MEFEQIATLVLESAPTALPLLWIVWRQMLAIERMHAMIERICGPCVENLAEREQAAEASE